MNSLYGSRISKFSLLFINFKLETKYWRALLDEIDFHILIFRIVFILASIYENGMIILTYFFTDKIFKQSNYNSNILFLLIPTNISIIAEIIFHHIPKLNLAKGSFLIINAFLIISETSMLLDSSQFAISAAALPLISYLFYIGLVDTRCWIVSSSSSLLGLLYLFLRLLIGMSSTYIQKAIYIFIGILTFASISFAFYWIDDQLRRIFFANYVNKQNQKYLKNFINKLQVPILWIKNKEVIFANHKLRKLILEDHIDEDLNNNFSDNYPAESRENVPDTIQIQKCLEKILNEKEELNFKNIIEISKVERKKNLQKKFWIYKNKERHELMIQLTKLILFEGSIDSYLLIDITEQDSAKIEAEKKYRRILIASISHELLTPINGIIGISDYDEDNNETLPTHYSKKVQLIKNGVKKIQFFVDFLKDFSALESNEFELNLVLCNVSHIIQELSLIFADDFKAKGLYFNITLGEDIETISFDKRRYSQVLYALIYNALKHTFIGGIAVKIYKQENTNLLITEVNDSGIGIEKNRLPFIFDLYSRNVQRNSLNPQGIGLYLNTCKKISQRMRGDIIVESEIEHGSKFIFSLELIHQIENHEHEDKMNSDRILMHEINQSNKCNCPEFLVVDDEFTNTKILKCFLKSINKKCDIAFNGSIAIEKILERSKNQCCKKYKLIFMDINMPVLDGEQATRILKEKMEQKEIEHTIIIAITACQIDNQNQRNAFLKIGFTDVFSKPLSKRQFLYIIQKYA